MLRFFRSTHQNLLNENKTVKYLKHAVGEVLIIMVGILLVLQLNNWNQKRLNKQSERVLLKEIHAEAIARFGGSDGIRDLSMLESAVAAPQASFGGQSPFADVVEVAAAYLFYIYRNHPFIDGNKRTALGASIVFLDLNGVKTLPDGPDWEALTLAVASSSINREETTKRLRALIKN